MQFAATFKFCIFRQDSTKSPANQTQADLLIPSSFTFIGNGVYFPILYTVQVCVIISVYKLQAFTFFCPLIMIEFNRRNPKLTNVWYTDRPGQESGSVSLKHLGMKPKCYCLIQLFSYIEARSHTKT